MLADDEGEEEVSDEEFDSITDEELEAQALAGTVFLRFSLGFEERAEELGGWDFDSDVCHCRIRVADSEGDVWEAKSYFTTDVFLSNMLDWQREEGLILFEDLEEAQQSFLFKGWKHAFQTRPLLEGMRGYYDDRSPRRLSVGGEEYSIFLKYQTPIFDVACLAEPQGLVEGARSAYDEVKLLVRVSDFYGSTHNAERRTVPPFVFAMPCETLMFHAETQGLPVPLVFTKVASGERPQPIVEYRSG